MCWPVSLKRSHQFCSRVQLGSGGEPQRSWHCAKPTEPSAEEGGMGIRRAREMGAPNGPKANPLDGRIRPEGDTRKPA